MKLCLWCKHMVIDLGSPTFSEMTIGDPGEIYCSKGKWSIDCHFNAGAEEKYRECVKKAEVCPDYIVVDL